MSVQVGLLPTLILLLLLLLLLHYCYCYSATASATTTTTPPLPLPPPSLPAYHYRHYRYRYRYCYRYRYSTPPSPSAASDSVSRGSTCPRSDIGDSSHKTCDNSTRSIMVIHGRKSNKVFLKLSQGNGGVHDAEFLW